MTEGERRPCEGLPVSPPPDAMAPTPIPITTRAAPAGAGGAAAIPLLHLASPPREVLEAIARAAHAHRMLRAQGRELRFVRRGGRIAVELVDHAQGTSTALTIACALELAAGAGR